MSEAGEGLLCSVIVPVYNGAAVIGRCLDALGAQSCPPGSYEIVVVDDGSVDATAATVQAWRLRHPAQRCRLAQQANAGPAAARNRGAQEAAAPLLLFTDADCAPLPDWIERMVAAFEQTETAGAKGAYLSDQRGLVPRFVQAEYEDRYDRMAGLEQIDFIDTYSAGYRRSIFLENGGFDPIFTTASVEDQEFSFRLAQKGYRLVFAPQARVKHLHDANVAEYARRKYYIGFWKALLTRWHPERLVQDSHTPPALKLQIVLCAALLALVALSLAAAGVPMLRWAWVAAALIALLFVATGLPFIIKLARRDAALALIGPPMLFVRALALGAGYAIGSIHFAGTLPGARQPVIPGWKRFVKRGMDIAGALIGLVVTLPAMALAAVAIKLDSPGPVLYRQVRIGENGRPFRIIKLRSMVAGAEQQLPELVNLADLPEPAFKLHPDPRVTRVGRVLRRISLDEAPQFINVLAGEMSLVGPRPEEERVVALYADAQRRRLAVKPGMTGPMQIRGRGNLTFAQRIGLELEYIDQYSLRRDIAIILRTIPVIVRGDGAF